MTEQEMQKQIEDAARAAIAAHPGATPEQIADLLVGKPKRHPGVVETEVRNAMLGKIADIPKKKLKRENEDRLVGKLVGDAEPDLDFDDVQALAWLSMWRTAKKLLRQ